MRRLELRHILGPVDFSPLSAASLSYASGIARARNAELRAFHVVPSEGLGVGPRFSSLDRQTVMSQLREWLADAAPGYDRIGAAVRHGDPGVQILRFARGMPADLIVMGAPGVDRPERPMGPVASVVVARSDCPVLTVPSHRAPSSDHAGLFDRIVCAVDLAHSSLSVIHQALSLAWETRGHVTYVCAVPKEKSVSSSDARKRLLGAIPPEASDWCEMDVVVTRGAASTKIVEVADELKADLVVIGAPRRWTSTTHAVLARSLCPVLVTHDARPLPRPAANGRRDRVPTSL